MVLANGKGKSVIGVFDIESTSVDVEIARIVTAFFGLMDDDGEWVEKRSWVIDPGVDIPEEAAKVHGYTNERIAEMRERGETTTPEVSLPEIAHVLESSGVPVVIYNAAYDLTVVDREQVRLGCPGLQIDRLSVIDPLVIDKAIDKYRKGSRKLEDTARHYDVPTGNAHDAEADCLMAGRLALKLREHLRRYKMWELMVEQKKWRKEQTDSLRAYFDRTGKEHDGVPGDWPMHPRRGER